jgi:ketosteroid isomerase-like protein
MRATAAAARALLASAFLCFAPIGPAATQSSAPAEIRTALAQWMADFNAGNSAKVCALFAPDLIAQYRGQPERNYDALCDLLKRSLSDRTRTYRYALDIKEILVTGELAVVRLTWTLSVRSNDAPGETIAHEPGMDIFRRQPDGTWKISRYIAYDISP